MKGTDLTEAQIQSARLFCNDHRKNGPHPMPPDEMIVTIPFGQLARIIAWYGALRFTAGRDGIGGTLGEPGVFEMRKGSEK